MTRHAARRLCIIEACEVPLRVWQTYADRHPASTIARLLTQGKVFRTVADDVEDEQLYPSQTCASLNTGLPYEEHGIRWYNDPKPDRHQFWWHQAACWGKRVSLVNVLHSSPLSELAAEGDYAFLIPDCFAADSDTHPENYRQFQELAIGDMPAVLNVGTRRVGLRQLGIGAVAVDDLHSGRHHPHRHSAGLE